MYGGFCEKLNHYLHCNIYPANYISILFPIFFRHCKVTAIYDKKTNCVRENRVFCRLRIPGSNETIFSRRAFNFSISICDKTKKSRTDLMPEIKCLTQLELPIFCDMKLVHGM